MVTRVHKTTGWAREFAGGDTWKVVPTDGSGERTVALLSAGTWQNTPNDDRARLGVDRVVLVSGAPLPTWAQTWLEKANAKSCEQAREAFRAAMEDDEDGFFGRNTGW